MRVGLDRLADPLNNADSALLVFYQLMISAKSHTQLKTLSNPVAWRSYYFSFFFSSSIGAGGVVV